MKKYVIITKTVEDFNEILTVLFSLGFVYSLMRFRDLQKIHNQWEWHNCIKIGFNDECKMTLHGSHFWNLRDDGYTVVSLEEYLEIFKLENE